MNLSPSAVCPPLAHAFGDQFFGKVAEPLEGGALLEEAGH